MDEVLQITKPFNVMLALFFSFGYFTVLFLKIILTLRDEDSWYRSLAKQVEILNKSYSAWFINEFTYSGIIRSNYRISSGK